MDQLNQELNKEKQSHEEFSQEFSNLKQEKGELEEKLTKLQGTC